MKKNILYILLVFIFLNSSFSYAEESLSLYYKAKIHNKKGEYNKASEILENIVKESPSDHVYMFLIENLLNSGQFDKAFKYTEEFSKVESKNVKALEFAAGIMEAYKKDYDAAYNYYNEAYIISGDNKYALSTALMCEKKKDYKKGISILDDLIKKEPDNGMYYTYRGIFQYNLKRNKKAIKDLEKAISLTNEVLAKIMLSEIYSKEGKNNKAISILEDILAENSEYEELVAMPLAKLYIQYKNYDKAIELYENISNKFYGSKKVSYLKLLAELFYEAKEYKKAADIFVKITKSHPKDKESFMAAGKIYEYIEDYDNSSSMYVGAIKIDPNYTDAIKRLAVVYLLQDKGEYALKQLNYIDKIEQDVDYFLLKGEAYSIQKKYKEAEKVLKEGLKENPTNPTILSSLASVYLSTKEFEKALEIVKKIYDKNPTDPINQNLLGYTYAEMGIELNKAKELIEKALKQEPENAAYLDSLGWVYYKMKNYEKAYKYLKKAYDISPEGEIKDHYQLIKDLKNK